jgi:NADPH:quinone reductase-like Zn-dependent oxidoreductase
VRKVRGDGGRTPLPGILGGEVAGTVTAIGPAVTGLEVGDRVTSLGVGPDGSYCELAIAPTSLTTRIPDGASAVQAAALVRSEHVALAALSTARLRATESLLITGAAS